MTAPSDTKQDAPEEVLPPADEDVALEESLAAENAEISSTPKTLLTNAYRGRN